MHPWFLDAAFEGSRPVGRPLLALSDIHGDLEALDAVLAEASQGPLCGIVAAGDHCFDGPDPFGVWQRLLEHHAVLVRGETDLALGALRPEALRPNWSSVDEQARLEAFLTAREALGDLICRRLAELPSTAVVSLDDRAGVMVVHGSPAEEHRSLTPDLIEDELAAEVGCVAEDVLVTGRSHTPFIRRHGGLLVVNAGSVGQSPVRGVDGRRTAHAVLIQSCADGTVRAVGRDVPIPERAIEPQRRARRRAG